jgi:hypothetical protein
MTEWLTVSGSDLRPVGARRQAGAGRSSRLLRPGPGAAGLAAERVGDEIRDTGPPAVAPASSANSIMRRLAEPWVIRTMPLTPSSGDAPIFS